ncbi:uncharacterized protein isoform X3 [Rhodnius prolixus]|uniref:uncharacterized protein isoform X3 n=1 Tax=Rhodnius prolixus TaxID=13249 RepID=UPI003D18E0B1
MLLQSWNPDLQYSGQQTQSQESSQVTLQSIQDNLKPGWFVHLTADNRLYYTNAASGSSSWIPPVEAWSREVGRGLPYGWEEAVDTNGKTYYINHVNKTTTYEEPVLDWCEEPPKPRQVSLTRHAEMGFGFVAGSERPVIVRFVTEGGPSDGKLLPGDHILEVNSEDVSCAPRDHVIQLVRASKTTVDLVVCQPVLINSLRKSAILSSAKKAKLKSNPSRVRFAEGVVVNGSPLFPGCTLSGGDWGAGTVLPNVLKVFLENGQTKSFKYDSNTTVGDVLVSLQSKLCLKQTSHFALVLEQVKTLRRNKLTLLNPLHTLSRVASRPGTHNLRCLFRVAFVPSDPCDLAQKDLAAFEYFYLQCCNDVVQERYAPELKYDVALRLAALHIHQHCLANNIQPSKITVKSVERDFGLERFVPSSLLETMKRKELRKVLTHLLKLNYTMTGTSHKCLTALQAKLYYLTIISQLPSYGAKCFPTNSMDSTVENVILVSPKLGISQITGLRNNIPIPVAEIEQLSMVSLEKEDHLLSTVTLYLPSTPNKELRLTVEERDAEELVLVLQGYYKLFTNNDLHVHQDPDEWLVDTAPLYHSQHIVKPAYWSYGGDGESEELRMMKMNGTNTLSRSNSKVIRSNGVDSNMNVPGKVRDRNGMKPLSPSNNGIDFHSVMSMEILEQEGYIDAHNPEVARRVAEMQAVVASSEEYLSRQQHHSQQQQQQQPCPLGISSDSSDISHFSLDNDAPPPAPLKHSDSLLLLTQGQKEIEQCVNEAFNSLEVGDTESDTDSLTTSPSHNSIAKNPNRDSDSSFGLHSPDNLVGGSTFEALQEVWRRVQETGNLDGQANLCLDPDIIDLTLLPPPITPDKEIASEQLLSLGLEEFLESTRVVPPPPTEAVDPTIVLTSEQISAFIIPPPPPPTTDEVKCVENGVDNDQSSTFKKSNDVANGSSQEYPSDLPQRPPKVSFKNPPPLPPRSDSFSKKQFPVEEDINVEALKITAEFSDMLSLSIAQTERSVNTTQEVRDMLGLELKRLVTSSKLLVRSHKCSNTTIEAGDYTGNLRTVTSQLRKAVDYGVTMEDKFVLGVLQVVTQEENCIEKCLRRAFTKQRNYCEKMEPYTVRACSEATVRYLIKRCKKKCVEENTVLTLSVSNTDLKCFDCASTASHPYLNKPDYPIPNTKTPLIMFPRIVKKYIDDSWTGSRYKEHVPKEQEAKRQRPGYHRLVDKWLKRQRYKKQQLIQQMNVYQDHEARTKRQNNQIAAKQRQQIPNPLKVENSIPRINNRVLKKLPNKKQSSPLKMAPISPNHQSVFAKPPEKNINPPPPKILPSRYKISSLPSPFSLPMYPPIIYGAKTKSDNIARSNNRVLKKLPNKKQSSPLKMAPINPNRQSVFAKPPEKNINPPPPKILPSRYKISILPSPFSLPMYPPIIYGAKTKSDNTARSNNRVLKKLPNKKQSSPLKMAPINPNRQSVFAKPPEKNINPPPPKILPSRYKISIFPSPFSLPMYPPIIYGAKTKSDNTARSNNRVLKKLPNEKQSSPLKMAPINPNRQSVFAKPPEKNINPPPPKILPSGYKISILPSPFSLPMYPSIIYGAKTKSDNTARSNNRVLKKLPNEKQSSPLKMAPINPNRQSVFAKPPEKNINPPPPKILPSRYKISILPSPFSLPMYPPIIYEAKTKSDNTARFDNRVLKKLPNEKQSSPLKMAPINPNRQSVFAKPPEKNINPPPPKILPSRYKISILPSPFFLPMYPPIIYEAKTKSDNTARSDNRVLKKLPNEKQSSPLKMAPINPNRQSVFAKPPEKNINPPPPKILPSRYKISSLPSPFSLPMYPPIIYGAKTKSDNIAQPAVGYNSPIIGYLPLKMGNPPLIFGLNPLKSRDISEKDNFHQKVDFDTKKTIKKATFNKPTNDRIVTVPTSNRTSLAPSNKTANTSSLAPNITDTSTAILAPTTTLIPTIANSTTTLSPTTTTTTTTTLAPTKTISITTLAPTTTTVSTTTLAPTTTTLTPTTTTVSTTTLAPTTTTITPTTTTVSTTTLAPTTTILAPTTTTLAPATTTLAPTTTTLSPTTTTLTPTTTTVSTTTLASTTTTLAPTTTTLAPTTITLTPTTTTVSTTTLASTTTTLAPTTTTLAPTTTTLASTIITLAPTTTNLTPTTTTESITTITSTSIAIAPTNEANAFTNTTNLYDSNTSRSSADSTEILLTPPPNVTLSDEELHCYFHDIVFFETCHLTLSNEQYFY